MNPNFKILQAVNKLKQKTDEDTKDLKSLKTDIDKKGQDIKDIETNVQKQYKEIREQQSKDKEELENRIKTISLTPGPQGEKGDKGEKGEQGDIGPKGENGKQGPKGEAGSPGKDGKDGFNGKDGKNGIDGKNGRDGKDGKDGAKGKDGVGIRNADINEKGELILEFTNDKTKNLGRVVGKDGVGFIGSDGVSVVKAEIKDHHLFLELSNGEVIDAGYIGGTGPGEEIDPIFTASPAYNITNEDITNWNKKSDFSGSYNDLTDKPTLFSGDYEDLTNKPTIPTVPTDISAFNNDVGYLTQHQDISGKEDKTNKVTSISSSSTDTEYPSAKSVYTTINNKFFYMNVSSSNTTTTIWSELYEAYSNDKIILAKIDYMQGITTVPVIEPLYLVIGNQSGGTFMFTFVMGTSSINYMVTGTGDDVCTVTKQEKSFEETTNKVQSVVSNKTSTTYYPSTKAVYNEFIRKPVLIYDKVNKLHISGAITSGTDDENGLLNQNQGEGTTRTIQSWNITGMNLSEFKRIRVVYSRNDGTSAVTGEFFIPLDADYITDGNLNAYVNGTSLPYYAVRTRLVGMTAAVSSDKTSFCVTQAISLTATTLGMVATTVNDMYVTKIEGYYE